MDEKTHEALWDRCMLAKGVVRLGGSVWLVQQNPWIQNKTIRDNILFGLPLHKERYNRTIETCQLADDLEILKGGDLTEIGEKGINLSGGQKARVSLARAVYSGWDIVLMDDPVSALDSNVKHKIFQKVFWGELKYKTRILITHAVEFLNLADRIVIMENGKVKHIGTFENLESSDEIKNVIQTIARTNERENKKFTNSEQSSDSNSEKVIKDLQTKRNYLSNESLKIIEDENKEVIEVSWRSYFNLFVKDWGWLTYLSVLPFLGWYCYFGMYLTYYWGKWMDDFRSQEKFWKYFTLVVVYVIIFTISISIATVLIYLSTLRKAKLLHEKMMIKILNAPINTYFEKTPLGNILNRFSRDLSRIDVEVYRYRIA